MVVQNGPKQKLPNGLFVLNKRADGKGGGMPLLDKVQKKSAFFLRSSLSCQGTTWLPADSLAFSEQLGCQTTAWLSAEKHVPQYFQVYGLSTFCVCMWY